MCVCLTLLRVVIPATFMRKSTFREKMFSINEIFTVRLQILYKSKSVEIRAVSRFSEILQESVCMCVGVCTCDRSFCS